MKRPDPVEYTVQNTVVKGHAGIIYGMAGSLKSILGADLSVTVPAGFDYWMGQKVQQTRVLYLDFELDWRAQGPRFYDIAAGKGMDDLPDGLAYLSSIHMGTQEAFQKAMDLCVEEDIGLVVLDSVGFAMQGDSESSGDVLGFLNNYVVPFEAAGIGMLMLDHVAKPVKGVNWRDVLPFGSVYKFNKARCVWQAHGKKDPGGVTVTLGHKKNSFGPLMDDYVIRGQFSKGRIDVARTDLDPEVVNHELTTEDRIMDALQSGPMYPVELADKIGVQLDTIKNQLTKLRRAGKVENTGQRKGQSNQVRVTQKYDLNALPVPDDEAA